MVMRYVVGAILSLFMMVVLSACGTSSVNTYEITYRVTKADAAFVNKVEWEGGRGTETVVSPPTPWAAIRYLAPGQSFRLAADAAGTAQAPVTLEVIVKRRGESTVVLQESRTCTTEFCTPTDFFIADSVPTN